ncbi:hypothetical protein [Christensenella tenuis]|uniref:Uncharacterized protein n=1 Tax=Christensenella tenuis TaxID=2763033 RepID=A0ABR7ECP4_9FIRM|nr:hypothetical protein [Christensenella tenuis]MBC5647547.1 hypothetical protein [Christensenella tenuis]
MTIREKLEQYRALVAEVRNLEQRISDMQTQKVSSCDIVKMSSPEFPFTEHSSKVIGHAIDKTMLQKVVDIYKDRLEKAMAMMLEVETFISSVEDSEMRELLRLRYVEGLPWWKIPMRLEMAGDGSWQRRLVYGFLQNFENCPESSD